MATLVLYKGEVQTLSELRPSKSGTPNPPKPIILSPSPKLWSRMRKNLLPLILSAVLSCTLLHSSSHATPATGPELEKRLAMSTVPEFSAFEYPIALTGLYANIGPGGSKSSGAASGVVIASPSTCKFVDFIYIL